MIAAWAQLQLDARFRGALIATTNYDGLLEDALGWGPVTWRDSPRLQSVLRGRERAVIHLHGHWRDPESVVFGSSSYSDVLRSPGAVTFLKTTVYARTLLFVGFGAGPSDPNFSSLRQWMRDELSTSAFRHYRLVRESEMANGSHDHRERIDSVPYGTEYSDLAPFLSALPRGVSGVGMRALGAGDSAPTAATGIAETSGHISLRPAAPSVEQAEALREAASKLAWVAEVADLPDDQVSTVIGGGVRVDEYRRFVSVLAEELDAVAARAAMQPTLDADSTRHALAWATRLLEILGSDSVEALDSSADTR